MAAATESSDQIGDGHRLGPDRDGHGHRGAKGLGSGRGCRGGADDLAGGNGGAVVGVLLGGDEPERGEGGRGGGVGGRGPVTDGNGHRGVALGGDDGHRRAVGCRAGGRGGHHRAGHHRRAVLGGRGRAHPDQVHRLEAVDGVRCSWRPSSGWGWPPAAGRRTRPRRWWCPAWRRPACHAGPGGRLLAHDEPGTEGDAVLVPGDTQVELVLGHDGRPGRVDLPTSDGTGWLGVKTPCGRRRRGPPATRAATTTPADHGHRADGGDGGVRPATGVPRRAWPVRPAKCRGSRGRRARWGRDVEPGGPAAGRTAPVSSSSARRREWPR